MCKDAITELARATIRSINPTSYGRMRTKLNKQGFSEVAIYTEIAQHCVDNDIDPSSMSKETLNYLEGCALNVFHPKVSNEFSFLRGKFHKLRHGDIDKGEQKSPEQKDQFLCNACFEVKPGKLRCRSKTEKHTCTTCKAAKSKAYNARKAQEKKAKLLSSKVKEESNTSSSIPTELIKALSTTGSGFKHEAASSQLSEALNSLPELTRERPKLEPSFELEGSTTPLETREQITEPELQTQEPEKQEMTQPANIELKAEQNKFGNDVKITEVMADAESATISIQCPTEVLHLVLASIKNL